MGPSEYPLINKKGSLHLYRVFPSLLSVVAKGSNSVSHLKTPLVDEAIVYSSLVHVMENTRGSYWVADACPRVQM